MMSRKHTLGASSLSDKLKEAKKLKEAEIIRKLPITAINIRMKGTNNMNMLA